MISHEQLIAGLVRRMVKTPSVTVMAPKTVSVEVYRQDEEKRVIIHLVNNTVDQRPATAVMPVGPIELYCRFGGKPRRVFRLREGQSVTHNATREGIQIRLPILNFYEVIVCEYGTRGRPQDFI
jgi:hypothetical protein